MTERVDLFHNIYGHFTEPVLNAVGTFLVAGERMGPWAIAGGAVVLVATVWRTVAPVLTPRLE